MTQPVYRYSLHKLNIGLYSDYTPSRRRYLARPRAYNHDIRCPECGSNRMPRNDASPGRQV